MKACKNTILEKVIDSVIHVLIIIIVLSIMFNAIISKATKNAMTREYLTVINQLTKPVRDKIKDWGPCKQKIIKTAIKTLASVQSQIPSSTKQRNQQLESTTAIVVSINAFHISLFLIVVSIARIIIRKYELAVGTYECDSNTMCAANLEQCNVINEKCPNNKLNRKCFLDLSTKGNFRHPDKGGNTANNQKLNECYTLQRKSEQQGEDTEMAQDLPTNNKSQLVLHKPEVTYNPTCTIDTFSWEHIFMNNAIALLIVGAFEFYFIQYIATKYIPTSEEQVIRATKRRVKDNIRKLRNDVGYKWIEIEPSKKFTEDDNLYQQLHSSSTYFENNIYYLKTQYTPRYKLEFSSIIKSNNKYFKTIQNTKLPSYIQGSDSALKISLTLGVGTITSIILIYIVSLLDKKDRKQVSRMNMLLMPIFGAGGMILAITWLYFNVAKEKEEKLNNRQAQRLVDYTMNIFNTLTTQNLISNDLYDDLEKTVNEDTPEDPKTKEMIEANNKPIEEKTTRIMSIIVGLLIVVIILATLVNSKLSLHKFAGTKFIITAVCTVLLGGNLALLCEYGFLNLVIGKYDGVDPSELFVEVLNNIQRDIPDDNTCTNKDTMRNNEVGFFEMLPKPASSVH